MKDRERRGLVRVLLPDHPDRAGAMEELQPPAALVLLPLAERVDGHLRVGLRRAVCDGHACQQIFGDIADRVERRIACLGAALEVRRLGDRAAAEDTDVEAAVRRARSHVMERSGIRALRDGGMCGGSVRLGTHAQSFTHRAVDKVNQGVGPAAGNGRLLCGVKALTATPAARLSPTEVRRAFVSLTVDRGRCGHIHRVRLQQQHTN